MNENVSELGTAWKAVILLMNGNVMPLSLVEKFGTVESLLTIAFCFRSGQS